MITFGDKDNIDDLVINSNGLFIMFEDEKALLSKVKERLRLFYAEWFLDTSRGVMYLGNILGDNININIAANILSDEILKEDKILNVYDVNFKFNSTTRVFTYTAYLSTIYGTSYLEFNNGNS